MGKEDKEGEMKRKSSRKRKNKDRWRKYREGIDLKGENKKGR